MKFVWVALAGFGMLITGAASASETLAKTSGCLTCHAMDKKIIGPSFKDIAAKYKGDKNAEANLVKKVKAGGAGVWGTMQMPPNAHVKEDDIKTLVRWVLTTK